MAYSGEVTVGGASRVGLGMDRDGGRGGPCPLTYRSAPAARGWQAASARSLRIRKTLLKPVEDDGPGGAFLWRKPAALRLDRW